MNEAYAKYIEQIGSLGLEDFPVEFLNALGAYVQELVVVKSHEFYKGEDQ